MSSKMEHSDPDDEKYSLRKRRKKVKPGVIYLSRIPPLMNVKKIRDIFSEFDEIGRIFLQPDDRGHSTKKGRSFTEGWVEFSDKKIAKMVALKLNNTTIGGKKKSRWYDEIWNMKYLHRFQWAHLNERLAYEKAVHKQRLRTEISQVKREANFHIQNSERNKRKKREKQKKPEEGTEDAEAEKMNYEISQKETDEEIVSKMAKNTDKVGSKQIAQDKINKKSFASRTSFLKSIFSGRAAEEDSDNGEESS